MHPMMAIRNCDCRMRSGCVHFRFGKKRTLEVKGTFSLRPEERQEIAGIMRMKKVLSFMIAILMTGAVAQAASVTNKDSENHVLVVTEDGAKREVAIEAGVQIEICPGGCFITLPSGDRETLSGDEKVEIINGSAVIN